MLFLKHLLHLKGILKADEGSPNYFPEKRPHRDHAVHWSKEKSRKHRPWSPPAHYINLKQVIFSDLLFLPQLNAFLFPMSNATDFFCLKQQPPVDEIFFSTTALNYFYIKRPKITQEYRSASNILLPQSMTTFSVLPLQPSLHCQD